MFTDPKKPAGSFPKLKGKAAECRHFGKALVGVWHKHSDPGNEHHQLVSLALHKNNEAEQILTDNTAVSALPHDEAKRLKDTLFDFLAIFQYLNREYANMTPPVLLFGVTIKAHMLAHIALTCHHLNPVKGWCYQGEDFMHVMRIMTSACCKGNTPAGAARKLMTRWVLAMEFRFRGHEMFK